MPCIMVIHNIEIQNFGAIDHFKHDFEKEINIIQYCYRVEIFFAMQLILNHRVPYFPVHWTSRDTKIDALVNLSDKDYRLLATMNAKHNNLCVRAYDLHGNDVTKEYLYLTAHCYEQDNADIFHGGTENPLYGLARYFEEDSLHQRELSNRTEKLSEIKAFRAYLKAFVKISKPEIIRNGKPYEIVLEANGRYSVRHNGDNKTSVYLSESERVLYRYLCFLRTAEFWQGFEELRNLHSIKKPILVDNFIERLDESIDTQSLLERTKRLNKQIIILTV